MRNFAVLIPIHNETNNKFLQESIQNLSKLNIPTMLIRNENFGEDFLENLPSHIKILTCPSYKRGSKFNYALQNTNYEYYIFHHPRSRLDPDALLYLSHSLNLPLWGAFTHQFDDKGKFYKFTSFYSNYIRGDLFQIYYLDHCLFCHRSLLKEIKGFPQLEIFEDTVFCQKLSRIALGSRLPFRSTTSSIRFQQKGKWKQGFKNFYLKLKFIFGNFNDAQFNQLYEEDLQLNNSAIVGMNKPTNDKES